MRVHKKRIILPIIVFLLGMSILGGSLYTIRTIQRKQSQEMASLNAITYSERMKTDIMQGVRVTDTLKQILISENGTIKNFRKWQRI